MRLSQKIFQTKEIPPTPKGGAGYDNPRENIDPHLKTKALEVKEINAGKIKILEDSSGADTEYVPMVLYNTDDTPPDASNYPIGTIYIQYTA